MGRALDQKNKRATLHKRFVHHPTLSSHALGSMQLLPNGNWLLGWGTTPYLTEYTRDGAVVFDARLPKGGQNYGVLKMPQAWQVEAGHGTSLAGAGSRPRSGFETRILLSRGTRNVRVTGVDRHGRPLGTSKFTSVG
ncbi:MAG TPA: arylsulfotransferase family protein [Gaiellaceae bacterium]|nr:arylsulfotransferase family protein [Gaiellaceae bacterium]